MKINQENKELEFKDENNEKGKLIKESLTTSFIDPFKNCSHISIRCNQIIDSLTLSRYNNGYVILIKEFSDKEPFEYLGINKGNFLNKRIMIGNSKSFDFELFHYSNNGKTFSSTSIQFLKDFDLPWNLGTKYIYYGYQGKIKGIIVIKHSWFYYDFYIYRGCDDSQKLNTKHSYKIQISKLNWNYLMRNTIFCNNLGLEFPIYNYDNIRVGEIRKENPSNLKYFFTGWKGVDSFYLNFPKIAETDDKIMLLGTTLLIDNLYIEDICDFPL